MHFGREKIEGTLVFWIAIIAKIAIIAIIGTLVSAIISSLSRPTPLSSTAPKLIGT
jgi:hypothetical protein